MDELEKGKEMKGFEKLFDAGAIKSDKTQRAKDSVIEMFMDMSKEHENDMSAAIARLLATDFMEIVHEFLRAEGTRETDPLDVLFATNFVFGMCSSFMMFETLKVDAPLDIRNSLADEMSKRYARTLVFFAESTFKERDKQAATRDKEKQNGK